MGDENYVYDKCVGARKESLIYNILIDVFMRSHGSYIIENGSSPTGGPKRKEKYKKKKIWKLCWLKLWSISIEGKYRSLSVESNS